MASMHDGSGATLRASIEIGPTSRTFATGLLLDLLAALRAVADGELIAVTALDPSVERDLETWSRLTGHAVVGCSDDGGGRRLVIRRGAADAGTADARPLGTRIWLYTNFDCNLKCDYCCVRSSPAAPRRELGLDRVRRIALEASHLGIAEFFITGGEPFLLPDIADIACACAAVAPVTLLTNGMLLAGRRRSELGRMPRDRVTLQISLDSPTPALHDAHRGAGTWQRAWDGIRIAREGGFRVRLAATVATADDEAAFRRFLDQHGVPERDRVIRRIALRGFAADGLALSRADLVPELTITAGGVYWHPVGADDSDLLVTTEIFPLAEAMALVARALERERELGHRLAQLFHCA
jgi:TusA-related sulfurtransferase/pyruvate-formate lyase-activating enzyme